MPFLIEIPDSDSLAAQVPEENDRYLVGGYRDEVVLIPWLEGPDATAAFQRFRQIRRGMPCGVVGLSLDGLIIFAYDKHNHDELAMQTACSELARTAPFAERRRKAEAVLGWLDDLFSLEDQRTESGEARA